jgi:hypothetical protein
MIDYASTPNTSGTFPNVVGLNVTSPGAGDGTPFLKSMIDDLWGARQAIMSHAGLTPDAVTESASASQFLTGIQRVAGHPGEVIAWDGNLSDPSSGSIRLLPLNGQGILRISYPDLDAAVYVGNTLNPTASAYYRATDAAGTSRSTTGAYLILPDRRGYVLRGLDTAASVDPDGASRDIGDTQDWALRKHSHYVWGEGSYPLDDNNHLYTTGATVAELVHWLLSGAESTTEVMADNMPSSSPYTSNVVPAANQSADENRMINSATRWCIRY